MDRLVTCQDTAVFGAHECMRLPHSEPYSEIRSEERAAFGWRVAAERVHHKWLRLIRDGRQLLADAPFVRQFRLSRVFLISR